MKLKELTRQLIEAHYEHLYDDSVRNIEKYLSPIHYLKEFRTISIGTGRQTGKTTLIAEIAKDDDLIITFSHNSADDMKRLRKYQGYNTNNIIIPGKLNEVVEKYGGIARFDRVFVDNSDLLKEWMLLDLIYENVAGRCNQLILIRG